MGLNPVLLDTYCMVSLVVLSDSPSGDLTLSDITESPETEEQISLRTFILFLQVPFLSGGGRVGVALILG